MDLSFPSVTGFCMGWKNRAAQTGKTTALHLLNQLLGSGCFPVIQRLQINPLLLAIGPDNHTKTFLAGRMRHWPDFNGLNKS